ncbi:Crp/Fnr family transcriptional regulator, partial [Sutterella sp.]|uniref:Crp/Fnr family transcriptional regulator n=1 Tax=Sutterella sp. TaxID=1981025 RepID=UPI003FD75806
LVKWRIPVLQGGECVNGIFAPGSILGGPKVLLHPAREIGLSARTLSSVRLRRICAERFTAFLDAHPAVKSDYLLTLAYNHEAQMDGLLVNGTEPVPVRLALLFESLADLEAVNAARGVACTVEPTVEELALMVHATRAVVNRVLCAWEREGRIAREHRRIRLLPGFRGFSAEGPGQSVITGSGEPMAKRVPFGAPSKTRPST